MEKGIHNLSIQLLKGPFNKLNLKALQVLVVSQKNAEHSSAEEDTTYRSELSKHGEPLRNWLNKFRETAALSGDIIFHLIELLPGVELILSSYPPIDYDILRKMKDIISYRQW